VLPIHRKFKRFDARRFENVPAIRSVVLQRIVYSSGEPAPDRAVVIAALDVSGTGRAGPPQ